MDIIIDIDHPLPLFEQLMAQIKQAVIECKINPGDGLPSIRQLANDLELNNKTVAKAYSLLERDEIIQSKGYRGTFVHPDAKKNSSRNLNEWVMDELTATVETLKKKGITDSEIRIAFGNVMKSTT